MENLAITLKNVINNCLKVGKEEKTSHYTNKPQLNLGKSIGSY